MTIIYHKNFIKELKKMAPGIKRKFKERIRIFSGDEFDPVLNNHALRGRFQGYRSINVTGDLRAIFKRTTNAAIFVTIGSHSSLYR